MGTDEEIDGMVFSPFPSWSVMATSWPTRSSSSCAMP